MAGDKREGANGEFDHDYDYDASVRVRVHPPLPCGMKNCAQPASIALAEPSRDTPGLWSLLPICTSCAARLNAASSGRAGAR